MNYTLIAYKPNNDDYCMGCHMASFSSDFELFCTTSEEELLDKWLDIRKAERQFDEHEAKYEITILFNGIDPDSGGCEEYEEFIRLREIIDQRFEQWSKEQDEEDAREKLRKEYEAKKREREDDVRQLKQLQKKLGVKR